MKVSKEQVEDFKKRVKDELIRLDKEYGWGTFTEEYSSKLAYAIQDFTVMDCLEEGQTPEDYADLLTW